MTWNVVGWVIFGVFIIFVLCMMASMVGRFGQ
jgi:hypothetical protein